MYSCKVRIIYIYIYIYIYAFFIGIAWRNESGFVLVWFIYLFLTFVRFREHDGWCVCDRSRYHKEWHNAKHARLNKTYKYILNK